MKTKWNLDGTHSGINFAVRHMVVSKVRGRFAAFVGALELDEADLTQSTIDVTIDASSIDTGTAQRDDHLRAADFFNVEKFRTLRYQSKRIEKLGKARFRLIGDLTIRDVTREVPLDVEYGGRGKDPLGNERAGFAARAAIDRRDFGLQWNHVLDTGGLLVGDKVDIDLDIQAVKAAAVEAA
jgi:polyisoprenoid-binding protein YceI